MISKTTIIVLLMILMDVITGIMQACKNKTLNSTVLREGLWHKLAEIVAIVFAYLVSFVPDAFEINVSLPLLTPVCVYIVIMEIISVLENICMMNDQLMGLFSPYLEKLKGERHGTETGSEE